MSVAGADDRGRWSVSTVPPTPPNWIDRDRLDRKLTVGTARRLTTVVGAPGSGKTALLAGWARRCSRDQIAWLSLEAADDDPYRFVPRLVGALREIEPGLGRPLSESLEQRRTTVIELIDLLSVDILAIRPAIVIIDDFHVVTRPEIIGAVDRLLHRLPPQVRIVLASRRVPTLSSHRLLLSGDLTEIRERDLRFTLGEAGALISSVTGRAVVDDDVGLLRERTEGWAAGLRMAAVAMAVDDDPSAFVRRFGGDSELVANYFRSEVLAGQPPEVVEFMLATSVLDRMTGELCGQLTGRADAEQVLETLAGGHLFVTRSKAGGEWYQYHPLLAEFLRHRLLVDNPTGAMQAHLIAGRWFEQHLDGRAAVHHLTKARAEEEALAVGVTTIVARLSGGLPLDREPLLPAELPDAFFGQDPLRIYALAVALLCALRTADAGRWIRLLDRASCNQPDRQQWQRRVAWLWAVHDGLLGEAAGVIHHCRQAAALPDSTGIPAGGWLHTVDAAIAAQIPLLTARAHLWLGETEEAGSALQHRSATADQSDDVALLGALARLAWCEGRLREAYVLARRAIDEAERQGIGDSLAILDARVALGSVLLDRDELDAAEQHFLSAVRLCERAEQPRWVSAVECELVRTALAHGRAGDALDRLVQLRDLELHNPLSDHQSQKLNETEIRCRLAIGDLEGAVLAHKSITPECRTTEAVARIDICAGRPDRAIASLSCLLKRPARLPVELERLALLARAHLQLGDRHRAEDALRRAIGLGRSEGYVRLFLDEVPSLHSLLQVIAGRFPDAYVARLLSHSERQAVSSAIGTDSLTLEPLTYRERELLSYLPSHLSQYEIGTSMYISVNTVKSHLKGVYRKLGASSRSEAVAVARANHLL